MGLEYLLIILDKNIYDLWKYQSTLKNKQNSRLNPNKFPISTLKQYFSLQNQQLYSIILLQQISIYLFLIVNYISLYQPQTIMQPDPHENLVVIQQKDLETEICKSYIKGNFLGKGGFARCYQLISEETKQIQAVKIIQKSSLIKPRSKQKLASQIRIHQALSHRNIVSFKRHFEDHLNVYIVLELCANKTLNDLLKRKRRLTQSQIKYYLLQVLHALEYLHARNIVHRDLKLGNLFLTQAMEVKMGDFGLATKLEFPGQRRKTICGTPNYIAPEILQARGHGCQVDIWSFGVIAYTMAFGRPPFQSKQVKQTYKKIRSGIYSFPDTVNVSQCFKQIVIATLQKDPHKRPTSSDLKKFQFFNNVTLSRQPSVSFKASISISKQDKQMSRSDNGKMYTNNQLITSKDTARQRSQDKFLATDRSATSIRKNLSGLKRTNSQRILKQSNQYNFGNTPNKNNTKNRTMRSIPPNNMLNNMNNNNYDYVSVKKWIDYSSKYGIGYALSNGGCGVYFNDSSKMIAFGDQEFFYVEKIQRKDVIQKYGFLSHPPELKKKVSLFGHFKGYLYNQGQNHTNVQAPAQQDLVYVRRWYRAKHAVIFRLSNKSVQVLFVDQSQILINSIDKQVAYISKMKQRSEYGLNQVMQSQNRQLIKRFQYTKEILNQMANHYQKN